MPLQKAAWEIEAEQEKLTAELNEVRREQNITRSIELAVDAAAPPQDESSLRLLTEVANDVVCI
jgi:hypothetical protein